MNTTSTKEANRVQVFDTTLRDGEQAPGFTMNPEEKITLAKQLERLGVDVIEAGFAASSPGDFESVRDIGHALKGPRVMNLCRAKKSDIDAGAEALQGSHKWGLHTFIASSQLHMKYKLKMTPQEVLKAAVQAVEHARRYADWVEFSPEDATRSEPEFLVQMCSQAIAAGASVINIPDTVGYTTPQEMYALMKRLLNEVKNADQVIFSVHCHDDLGLAMANSIAALSAGARQVECTINGIGERAGNASLEEIVMALKTRKDLLQLETNIQTEMLYPTSRLLTQLTGMGVQANKAIVGANAFAHEAGIHQDGVLKNPLTYEIMTPESVGIKSSHLVLGKHSGRHALLIRTKELGYDLSSEEVDQLFQRFKQLADAKKVIYDEDLEALLNEDKAGGPHARCVFQGLKVISGTEEIPYANVSMQVDGRQVEAQSQGDGPVDATFKAICKAVGAHCTLKNYQVQAITGGTDALGEVIVVLEEDDKTATGRGSSPDIIVASAMAFVAALNRLEHSQARMIEGV